MDQILHVFRKDARRHWPEILLSIAILSAYAWNEPGRWRETYMFSTLHERLVEMVVIGWFIPDRARCTR
jgi:hypothetical protein